MEGMDARYRARLDKGWSRADALSAVRSEAEGEWHRPYAPPADPDHCAACGVLMLTSYGMRLSDGAVVCLDDIHGLSCLIRYGLHWRGIVREGLTALGVMVEADYG